MDPLSTVTSLLSLADIALRTTNAVLKFAEATRNATADRKLLAEEASSLSRILERLRDRALSGKIDATWLKQHFSLVQQFQHALDDLTKALKLDVPLGQLRPEAPLRAALTAARWSFTKSEVYAILERLTRLQQYATVMMLDEQSAVVDRIAETQQEEINAQLRTQITNWISPLHMSQLQRTFLERTERGSGDWFFECAEFKRWVQGPFLGTQKLLWCSGMPGAGKTIITSLVFNHLQRLLNERSLSMRSAVAVLYLRYNDSRQTLDSLLGSLIKQLLQNLEIIPRSVSELYHRHFTHDTMPSLVEMSGALESLLREFDRAFVLVDGLDECSEDVRWSLMEILQCLDSKPSLLFTSRHIDAIGEELKEFDRVEIRAHQKDIELYIDQQIRKNRNLRKLVQKSPNVRGDIKRTVVALTDGMFLLARLHVESLSAAAALSIRRVRNKLNTLPTTLDDSYRTAMQRIRDQDGDISSIALKALSWLVYAYRSLSIGELQHALMIEAGDNQLDDEAIMDGQSITACCAGLVVIDQASNTVHLVHYTAKRYLEGAESELLPGFHATITMSCATYLTLDTLRDRTLRELVHNFPLACYAAQYLGDHARESPEESLDSSVLVIICDLLSSPKKRKPLLSLLNSLDLIRTGFYPTSSQNVLLEDEDFTASLDQDPEIAEAVGPAEQLATLVQNVSALSAGSDSPSESSVTSLAAESAQWKLQPRQSRFPEVTALHLAASMGLAKVASMLLRQSSDIDAVDDNGKTALAIAIERGMQSAVRLLVENGASVALDQMQGQRMFLLAADRGWHEVAETIIRRATEHNNLVRPSEMTRLLIAAYRGQSNEIHEILESADLTVDVTNIDYGFTALLLAVVQGHCHAVDSILGAGVGIDTPDGSGQTPLHHAARRRDITMLQTLVSAGASVNGKDDDGWTALTANTKSQDKELAQYLLSAGCDPNVTAHNGLSELYEAATVGDATYVRFLLDIGTDPSIRTRPGWAPLHWASAHGHVEIVGMLIEAKADLCVVSDQNVTPLDLALSANQLVIAEMLDQAGARRGSDVLRELNENGASATTEHTYTLDPIADGSKLFLMFDEPALDPSMRYGQFIYQPESDGRVYYLSHLLNDNSSISLRVQLASKPGMPREYPLVVDGCWPSRLSFTDDLFEVSKPYSDNREYLIRGGPLCTEMPTTSIVKSWTGDWKVHQVENGKEHLAFSTVPDWTLQNAKAAAGDRIRFVGLDGHLLARMNWLSHVPVARIEGGMSLSMQHLLVACWIAMLWSETVSRQAAGKTGR